MKTKLLLGLLVLSALVQLAVPASLIARYETALRAGQVFKFRTVLRDPLDPLRGRYVALGLDEHATTVSNAPKTFQYQKVYALVAQDTDGFARITAIALEKPVGGAYITARAGYTHSAGTQVFLPLTRFYMEESAAPQAEQAFRAHSGVEHRDAYVSVRVHNGDAVIEDLYIDGKTMREYLATLPEAAKAK